MVRIQSLRIVPRRPCPGNGHAEGGGTAPGDGTAPMDGDTLLALLASGDPPAFATDSRDRIVFWNRGMADLLGRTSHTVLGRRCYETLGGRDIFGNLFCYANCPVVATSREGHPVCGFELDVSTGDRERRAVGITILRVPGARPDIFTLVHIVQPVARAGRFGQLLADLAGRAASESRSPAEKERRAVPPALTPRETEVLHRVASGLQNKEVADKLGLSVATVRNHVHNILDKLGVHSKLEAVSLAFRNGWIVLDEGPAPGAAGAAPDGADQG